MEKYYSLMLWVEKGYKPIKEFCISWERRTTAKLEAALKQLEELGIKTDQGYKRESVTLTAEGFELADNLLSEQASN